MAVETVNYADKKDFWYYGREYGRTAIKYSIDGKRMLWGESHDYLVSEKGMSLEEASRYLNTLAHL